MPIISSTRLGPWRFRLAALRDRPLIWLLPFFLAGLTVGWERGGPGALFMAGAVLLVVPAMLPEAINLKLLNKLGVWLLIPAVFSLGWGLSASALAKPDDPHHLLNYASDEPDRPAVILGGRVLEGSGARPGRSSHRLIIDAREILIPGPEGPAEHLAVRGKARLAVGGADGPAGPLKVEAGDYVRLPVVLRPVAGFKNPGGFDLEKYWGAQGVWVGGFVKSPRLVASWPAPDGGGLMAGWRSRAENFIRQRAPGPASGILAAQLLGRRQAVDQASEETFRALGLSHLLAVSGLHLGLWYGLCFWVLRKVLRLVWPGRPVGGPAAALAVIPALFYAGLVGPAAPVMRAAVMCAAVALAALAFRRADPWNVLAAAAWILLLARPGLLFTASFQLSFVATAAMIAVFSARPGRRPPPRATSLWRKPINRQWFQELGAKVRGQAHQPPPPDPWAGRPESFFSSALKAALAGSLVAAPVVVHHFSRLPLAGLGANLVFTPLLSFLSLVPGLVGLAILPLSPAWAGFCLDWSAGVLAGLLPLMDRLAAAAGPGWLLPAPGAWFTGCWFLAAWAGLRGRGPARRRWLAAGALVLAGLGPGLLRGPGERDVLRLTVLDVGQGSAVHVNWPDGGQMLIDGGGTYSLDPGETVITPYLLHRGLRRLDVAALTHPDQDHLKGLLTVARLFRPREIWTAPWPPGLSRLYDDFAELPGRRPPLTELHAGRSFGPARADLLWPPEDLLRPEPARRGAWVNDHGLVWRLSWDGISFLITGDIGPKTEAELVRRHGRALRSTVLLAPHHGGRDSLTPAFLEAVRPRWVVFSAGRFNSYGFPHPQALARAAGARQWRTDLQGAAVFEVRTGGGRTGLAVRDASGRPVSDEGPDQ